MILIRRIAIKYSQLNNYKSAFEVANKISNAIKRTEAVENLKKTQERKKYYE